MFENLFDEVVDIEYNLNYNEEQVSQYMSTNKVDNIKCIVTPKTDHGMLVLAEKMNPYDLECEPFSYTIVSETSDRRYKYMIPDWALENSIEVADYVKGIWVDNENDEHLEVKYV